MQIPDLAIAILITAAGIVAAWSDLKTGQVPNVITLPLMGLGILYQVLWGRNFWFLLYWQACYIMWILNLWGGGDAKLVMGIFAFFPTREALLVMSLTVIVLGIGALVLRKQLKEIGFTAFRLLKGHFPSQDELEQRGERDTWVYATGGMICAWLKCLT